MSKLFYFINLPIFVVYVDLFQQKFVNRSCIIEVTILPAIILGRFFHMSMLTITIIMGVITADWSLRKYQCL